MKESFVLFLFLSCLYIPATPVTALPQIDGMVTNNEWEGAEHHIIELNTGIELNLSIIYTATMVYYLAAIDHSNEVNKINLNPSEPHDYFGIEFDNNKDGAIMGTSLSPDDTIIVNYEENYGADMYMHSFKAFYDTDYNGEDNVEGKAGTDGTNLFFEIARPLKSGDKEGYDLDLTSGETYNIMVAFWDDQPARSANAAVNKRIDNDQFLTLTVNASIDNTYAEIISGLTILISVGLAYLYVKFGGTQLINKIRDHLGK